MRILLYPKRNLNGYNSQPVEYVQKSIFFISKLPSKYYSYTVYMSKTVSITVKCKYALLLSPCI